MSVLRPVGPLPARAYWLRRGLLLLLAVALLFLASWAWGAVTGGGDGSAPGSSAAPSTSPTTGGSPTPSATESAAPSPSPTAPSASPSPSASASGTAVAACAAADVSVVTTPSKTTYTAGQDPRFTIKVTNTSKQPCKRNVGQKAMELRVSQGDTLVWSSDHCAPGGSSRIVTLKPGASYSTSVVWSRSTSKKGCPTAQPDAAAGTYALTGRNVTVTSKPTAFALA